MLQTKLQLNPPILEELPLGPFPASATSTRHDVEMVKNAYSSSNLRGSTPSISLRASQMSPSDSFAPAAGNPQPSPGPSTTRADLAKHLRSLCAHREHIVQPGYWQGSCGCGPSIAHLNGRETNEALERLRATFELRIQNKQAEQERKLGEGRRGVGALNASSTSQQFEHAPQSTLFSKFDTSLNRDRKTESYHSEYDAFNLEHLDLPGIPSSATAFDTPDYAYPAPKASLFDRFTEKTTNELSRAHSDSDSSSVDSSYQPSNIPPQFLRQAPPAKEIGDAAGMKSQGRSLITKGLDREMNEQNVLKSPEAYTQPFCDFLTENPTVWHAVKYFEKKLDAAGFKKLSERQTWNSTLEKGGKYYVTRNGSSLLAFTVGKNYKSGNGVAMIAGHVDALTARLKPISAKTTKAGYIQLGVAPYAGALNSTWWDRDLGIGGRVLVKDGTTGKIETKLVKLGWPIARIPTLAPHFGVGMTGSNNAETEAVPIIGLDSSSSSTSSEFENLTLGGAGSFTATQPPKLVRAIAGELSIKDCSSIVNWELELYDTQPAQVGGLEKEFIFAGRIDDKLCSWAAVEALLASAASSTSSSEDDGIVKLVGVFDDEEIGSLLRQGARGNFLPSTIERITESFTPSSSANILSQTYANSFLVSADVIHAVNPNFLSRYLENHAPRLNVGVVVSADSNGHMTTDSVSTALLTRVAEKSDSELQVFMIRNDSRSGGTVGPMLSSAMGVRAIDAGIPQLSMHSIRATTGALDPGLGVKLFKGFLDSFESIDKEFE